ncbi:YybH family protein [Piscinibacter sakaiensis]|uniref:YybH family protein n=1 Tax=Piscinibacter sakaiensis TaxID=1547922 RepID=UPI003AB066F4
MTATTKPSVAHLASPDEMEQQFYDALRHGDIERLMSIWADEEEISCVHPGGPRLVGALAIRASFDGMFANGVIDVQPQQVRRVRTHSTAVHSVVEAVRVAGSDGPQTAWVLATNVYIKTGLGWRMVAHHASPGSARDVADAGVASVLH